MQHANTGVSWVYNYSESATAFMLHSGSSLRTAKQPIKGTVLACDFVAPLGGAVEPLIHAPEAVQTTRIGGIGVVDDAILEHERAHARPLARVRGHVGSSHGHVVGDRLRDHLRCVHCVAAALVVVFDAPSLSEECLFAAGASAQSYGAPTAADRSRKDASRYSASWFS